MRKKETAYVEAQSAREKEGLVINELREILAECERELSDARATIAQLCETQCQKKSDLVSGSMNIKTSQPLLTEAWLQVRKKQGEIVRLRIANSHLNAEICRLHAIASINEQPHLAAITELERRVTENNNLVLENKMLREVVEALQRNVSAPPPIDKAQEIHSAAPLFSMPYQKTPDPKVFDVEEMRRLFYLLGLIATLTCRLDTRSQKNSTDTGLFIPWFHIVRALEEKNMQSAELAQRLTLENTALKNKLFPSAQPPGVSTVTSTVGLW